MKASNEMNSTPAGNAPWKLVFPFCVCKLADEVSFKGAGVQSRSFSFHDFKDAYFHSSNFIDTCKGFCEEVLTEGNNVTKQDQMMMLNKSTSFFKEKDKFDIKEFEKEILPQAELKEAFRDYRQTYNDKMDLTAIDDFEISPTAVKKNQKFMKSVVKLDKNFHIYVHGRHDYVEKGYDEEKGLKFYKLYYTNEDFG